MSDNRKLATPRHLADGRVCCSCADALCPACAAHQAVASTGFAPPNPYAKVLRAAEATPLNAHGIPDGYAAGLAKLRAQ